MKTLRIFLLQLVIVLLHWNSVPLHAQQQKGDLDSLERVMDRNYKPYILGLSEKGTYVTVQKRYGRSSDTVAVYDTGDNNRAVADIVGYKSGQVFLGDDALVSTNPNKAEYRNLKTGLRYGYDNVKRSSILPEKMCFSILDSENTVSVYGRNGNKRYSLDNVIGNQITDDLRNAFVTVKNGNEYELYNLAGSKPMKLLVSKTAFDHVMFSSSKNFLLAMTAGSQDREEVEGSESTVMNTLLVIDVRTGKVMEFLIQEVQKHAKPEFMEFGNGASLLMKTTVLIPRNKSMEIWYGNDGDLQRNELGTDRMNRYLMLDLKSGTVREISMGQLTDLIPSGNDRHFLAFRAGALQNYSTLWQNVDMHAYDRTTGNFSELDIVKAMQVYLSENGHLIAYKNTDDRWVIADLLTGRKNTVRSGNADSSGGKGQLRNPVFASNDREIYFESDLGLVKYSVKTELVQVIQETKGKKSRIISRTRDILAAANGSFDRLTLGVNDPLIIELIDVESNTVSYGELKNNRWKVLLPETGNKITSPYFTKSLDRMVYVEENYDLIPKVMLRDLQRKKTAVVSGLKTGAFLTENRKQEIIRYRDSSGNALKGVLYYPAGFNPEKKYPMVVRIYQIQSKYANDYPIVGYSNPPAFDLKRLVENGYFVYLPDIVFGDKGTGMSALDCVNKALDAVADKTYIDTAKIGLTGHSHGGYETNFIATHSNRFAAYLSGAGNSDLVRSYFSYNYNFHSPFYWQYENGQYEMPASFVEDKELYIRNSPVYYAEKVNAPILLWAGKKDKNIAWDQVMEFFIALKRNRKDVIALFYPDQGHAPGNTSPEGKDLYRKTQEWWDYFLKDQRNVPWIDKQMIEE